MTDLPLPLPYCSIRIQYSGPPGSAIAEVSSVEQREDLVVDSRLGNEGDGRRGSGHYPWHLDDETQSIFFLTNMSDKEARIAFQVQAGATQYSGDLKLGPRETQAINIRKLRDDQKADFQGHKIPAGATDGCVRWVRIGSGVPIMARVVVINTREGMASNYNCTGCCGPTYWNMEVNPSSATILVGGTQSFTANAVYQDCNGFFFKNNVTTLASWASSSPSVATVSGATATGQGAGSATIQARYSDCAHWDINLSNNQCECTIGNVSQFNSATLNVGYGCNDQRDFIIQEYVGYAVGFQPTCANFTQTARSIYFSFNELNTGDYLWALVKRPMVVGSASGYGLDKWREAYGGPRIINSAYRNPVRNAAVGGVPQSRHEFGDAADLRNQSSTVQEWNDMVTAARIANADFAGWRIYAPMPPSRIRLPGLAFEKGAEQIATQNPDTSFKYTITKSGAQATCTVGVNCAP